MTHLYGSSAATPSRCPSSSVRTAYWYFLGSSQARADGGRREGPAPMGVRRPHETHDLDVAQALADAGPEAPRIGRAPEHGRQPAGLGDRPVPVDNRVAGELDAAIFMGRQPEAVV